MLKCLMFFLCCLFSAIVHAQTATLDPLIIAQSNSDLLPVASPEDFKKSVSNTAQQNANEINQQSKDILSAVPPPPKSEPLLTQPDASTMPPIGPSPIEPKPTVITPPPAQAKPIPSPAPLPVNPDAYSNYNRAPVSQTISAPSANTGTPVPLGTAPQQTQVYTGFQPPANTSTTTTTTTTAPQQPKSGWNIRY